MAVLMIYEGKEGTKKFLEECKFWSNAVGDLHYHGKYALKEEELPGSLQRAYQDLFTEGTGSYCHLAEFRGEFGITLSNEFDTEFREDLGLTKEEYWDAIKKKAAEIRLRVGFKDCKVFAVRYGEKPYPEAEILAFMPWYIPKPNFNAIANGLYENVYKLDHPKIKLEDADVLRIYDNRVSDSEIQDAAERNLDIVGCVEQEMYIDDENESEHFLNFYRRGSDLVKASVDATLIYLCGHDLKNIIARAEPQEE